MFREQSLPEQQTAPAGTPVGAALCADWDVNGVRADVFGVLRDQEQADGVSVLSASEAVVDEGDVEAELTEVLGLELAGLEFDDDVTELLDVEKQQVDVEVVAVDLEVHLPADERESVAELAERVDDPVDECLLEMAFLHVAVEGEKVQHVRIFRQLLREV